MMKNKMTRFYRAYNLILILLSLGAVLVAVLGFSGKIQFTREPYLAIVLLLPLAFALDYAIRLLLAHGRRQMINQNTFSLTALAPSAGVMSPAQLRQVVHSASHARAVVWGGLRRRLHRLRLMIDHFLRGGGLIYYIGLTVFLIMSISAIYAYAERTTYGNALWWAVVTATTVGYGDISPHTVFGRLVAVVLMFNGIGLISTLTSSITAYLTNSRHSSSVSPAKELQRLQQLKKDGALTQTEFDQAKKKLLNQ